MSESPDPGLQSRGESKWDYFWQALSWLVWSVGLYLLPPIAVLVDDEFLKTRWIDHHFPPALLERFCWVYPWFCRMFGG